MTDVDLDHLAKILFVKLAEPLYNTIFPLSILYCLEEKTILSLHLGSRELGSPPWEQSIYIHYLKFCTGALSLLHLLMYSIIYISTLSCIVILHLGLYSVQLYFFAQIIPALGTASSFNWLLCRSDIPNHCVYVAMAVAVGGMLSTSLFFGTTRSSRFVV